MVLLIQPSLPAQIAIRMKIEPNVYLVEVGLAYSIALQIHVVSAQLQTNILLVKLAILQPSLIRNHSLYVELLPHLANNINSITKHMLVVSNIKYMMLVKFC